MADETDETAADAEGGETGTADAEGDETGTAGAEADETTTADAEDTGPTAAAGDLAIREPPRILVPVEVLEGQTVSDSLVSFLAPAEIVLLGYHVIPEQTPAEQASMQWEERAQAAVEDIAGTFREAGREVETRVVFTHDRDKTLDRVARELGATAVLLPNPAGDISEVLVPLRGAVDVDRLADLVATLVGEEGTVTLWDLTGEETGTELLDDATAQLQDRGLSSEQVLVETGAGDQSVHGIVDRSDAFDIVVMGEGEETLLTTVFGETSERIAEGAVAPVLVVRRRETPDAVED